MRYLFPGLASLLFYLVTFPVAAVSIYECEDPDGNRTYQERCPPGTTPVQEKKFSTGKKAAPASVTDINATFYTVPACEPCDEIRDFLTVRDITFTEKNVSENTELQEEVKTAAGELRVPVVIIGETVIKGYNRTELMNALTAAGYIEPESPSKPAESSETEEGLAAEPDASPETEAQTESEPAAAAEPAAPEEPATEEPAPVY